MNLLHHSPFHSPYQKIINILYFYRIRITYCVINLHFLWLFTINQSIINNTDKSYNFYPYGQIIRNQAPEITNFYILHEGLLGVFDYQLVEKDYEDIEEKKYSINANSGWLGITDKYWITSLIPEEEKKFKAAKKRSGFGFDNEMQKK